MGLFLPSIANEINGLEKKQQQCWKEPLLKVKEQHGIFKSVCDNFTINYEDFKEIFGSLQMAKIWDPEDSGKVDALELFCGLIMFAKDCTFKNKLSFLFSIFDFNEIKSLSFVDVEVMILCICNSTYKILKKNAKTNEPQISQWLSKSVRKNERVKITKLFNFCVINEEINKFFSYVGINLSKEMGGEYDIIKEQLMKGEEKGQEEKERKMDGNELRENLQWHYAFYDKLVKVERTDREKKLNYGCTMGWVYGIADHPKCQLFTFINDEEIFYVVSSVGIIYNLQTNKQKIYSCHKKAIKCTCYSKKKGLMGTGEVGKFPTIHFWGSDLKNEYTLETLHREGMLMMEFVLEDEYLVTVGERGDCPIAIYSVGDWVAKYQIILRDEIVSITCPNIMVADTELSEKDLQLFSICSENKIYHVYLHEKAQQYDLNTYEYSFEKAGRIVCTSSIILNLTNPYLSCFGIKSGKELIMISGHVSGTLNMLAFNQKGDGEQLAKFPHQILCLRVQGEIVIIGEGFCVHLVEVEALLFKEQPFRTISLPDCNLKLLSETIKFIGVNEGYLLVMSQKGDFVKMEVPELAFADDSYQYQEQERITPIKSIVSLSGPNNLFCLLEKDSDAEQLLCVTASNRILGINTHSHVVENAWEIGENESITAIDAVCSDDGAQYIITGCESGNMLIRVNLEDPLKHYKCESEITEIKISRDCSYLLVLTKNNCILFFSQNSKNFTSPRKLIFENEIPSSINFLDNFKFFLVVTSAKNSYVIEIPQLKHKNLQKEIQKITVSKVNLRYPYLSNRKDFSTSCSIIGGNLPFAIVCSQEGVLHFFRHSDQLKHGNFVITDFHHCPISHLHLNEQQTSFYSMGSRDNSLVQWSVFECVEAQSCSDNVSKSSSFERMKELSTYHKLVNSCQNESQFYFKGTKIAQLNSCLEKYHQEERKKDDEEEKKVQEQEELEKRRAPNISLSIANVYGIENIGKSCIWYFNNGQELLSFTSRFITAQNIDTKEQRIYEPTKQKISCVALSGQQVIYATISENPAIHVMEGGCLPTTHTKGILHMTVHEEFLISYGICHEGFSINLHNYRGKELLHHSVTYHQVTQFLVIDQQYMVSLDEVRVWSHFCPSHLIIEATAGALLPQSSDVVLGVKNGGFAILSGNKLHLIEEKAHQHAIDLIHVRCISDDAYEIISIAGKDERVKIWSQSFECKLMISLRQEIQFMYTGENGKPTEFKEKNISVLAMDCYQNKILLYFHMGKVLEISTHYEEKNYNKNDSTLKQDNSINYNGSDKSINDSKSQTNSANLSDKMTFRWSIVLDSNMSKASSPLSRFTLFSAHPTAPILVYTSNSPILLAKDYRSNQTLFSHYFSKEITAVSFAPNGNTLILGFNDGEIRLYSCKVNESKKDSSDNYEITIKFCQSFPSKSSSKIINVEFSSCSEFFAVSYIRNLSQEGNTEIVRSLKTESRKFSLVTIFRKKQSIESKNEQSMENNSNDPDYYDEVDNIENSNDLKGNSRPIKGVYYMSFVIGEGKSLLVIYEQYISEHKIRLNDDTKGKYKVYNIQQKVFEKNEFEMNWSNVNFPNSIYILQKKYEKFSDDLLSANSTVFLEENNENKVIITAMSRMGKQFLFYGTNMGDIHIVKTNSLICEKNICDYERTEMNLSKVYPCLTSFINRLQVSYDNKYLFASGIVDDCIVKYHIHEERKSLDLDSVGYKLSKKDVDGEYLEKNQFQHFFNNVVPIRDEIEEICLDVGTPSSDKSLTKLEVLKVFGRRAFDRHNNLYYDGKNLIYTLGPNIVVQDPNNPFNQEIIPVNPNPSNSPEISAFAFNGTYLIASTQEELSTIYIWNILTKTCLSQVTLQFSIVYQIAQLQKQPIILVYGVNSRYEASMQIIDWKQGKVLSNVPFVYSAHWRIKDLTQVETLNSQMGKFISCGVQHLCCWQYLGDMLTYSSFNHSLSHVTFMVVKSMESLVVTGCNDGLIYLWRDEKLLVKNFTHRSTIRALLLGDKVIYSGGMDSMVVKSEVIESEGETFLEVQKKLDLTQVCPNLLSPRDSYPIEYDIQSLALNEKDDILYVGTRSGTIWQADMKGVDTWEQILCAHDNEQMSYVCFDAQNQSYFYMITLSGLIEVWSLATLTKLYSHELEKRSQKLFSFKNYLIICCDRDIITIQIDHDRQSSIKYIKALSKEYDGMITDCCLSGEHGSKYYLALSLKKNQTNEIIINEINQTIQPIYTVLNLKYEIDYLDFSVDNEYLLFKDNFQEIGMINLNTLKRINTIFVEMNIEWRDEGLRISPFAQKIYCSYSRENKITAIQKLSEKELIIGDEMGTIRIFNYVDDEDRIGELHTSCYTTHMNVIRNIKVHDQYVLTTSDYDRSVILWKKCTKPVSLSFSDIDL